MNKIVYLFQKMLNSKRIKVKDENSSTVSLDTLFDENVTYSIEGSKLVIKSVKDMDLQ